MVVYEDTVQWEEPTIYKGLRRPQCWFWLRPAVLSADGQNIEHVFLYSLNILHICFWHNKDGTALKRRPQLAIFPNVEPLFLGFVCVFGAVCKGQRSELHGVFDFEKADDGVTREELWYCLQKSGARKYEAQIQHFKQVLIYKKEEKETDEWHQL